MMPIEYIYADWYQLIAKDYVLRSNPDYIGSREEVDIEAGSQAEGFCIPEMHVPKNTDHFPRYEDQEHASEYLQVDLDDTEHWISDHDAMTVNDSFLLNEHKLPVSIFSEVFHAEDDPSSIFINSSPFIK
ncbi:hypothetical protein AC249_AIPGENE3246 [Exaiptasia diaphana]|nr:hypothetical protein AC249_AIPGENE3246 [Exaiptasia diaphana]